MKRGTDAKHSEQEELREEQFAELKKRLAELDENPSRVSPETWSGRVFPKSFERFVTPMSPH